METLATCGNRLDLVDHIGATYHFAKYGVAPALGRGRGVVQETVVGHIDEELRAGRVRVVGARHGHGVVGVFQAVLCFVLDRRVGGLLGHAGFKAATLHHEAGNHAVKDGVVVVALLDVREEVGHRLGRLFLVKFQGDDAVAGNVEFDLGVAHGNSFRECAYSTTVAELMVTGVLGTFWYGPLLLVATALILSTTSAPSTTFPNTA